MKGVSDPENVEGGMEIELLRLDEVAGSSEERQC